MTHVIRCDQIRYIPAYFSMTNHHRDWATIRATGTGTRTGAGTETGTGTRTRAGMIKHTTQSLTQSLSSFLGEGSCAAFGSCVAARIACLNVRLMRLSAI